MHAVHNYLNPPETITAFLKTLFLVKDWFLGAIEIKFPLKILEMNLYKWIEPYDFIQKFFYNLKSEDSYMHDMCSLSNCKYLSFSKMYKLTDTSKNVIIILK